MVVYVRQNTLALALNRASLSSLRQLSPLQMGAAVKIVGGNVVTEACRYDEELEAGRLEDDNCREVVELEGALPGSELELDCDVMLGIVVGRELDD